MSAQIHVLRDVRGSGEGMPGPERLSAFAQAAIGEAEGELNLRIVSAAESQRLNAQFRGKHKPTNVLSFPPELPPDWPVPVIGDLALCAAVIRREAAEQGKTLEAHWAHMVVHGCLHLQGWDHQTDTEAEAMEAREIAVLSSLGFANPYLLSADPDQAP